MKKTMCNLIIVDASGSMSGKEEAVKEELKSFFREIKGNKKISSRTILIDFSGRDDLRVLLDTEDKRKLKDSFADEYRPRAATALNDAIGYGFSLVGEKNYDGVFVSILTDGQENDSKEYTTSQIKALIENKRALKWAIIFSGCSEGDLREAVLGYSISTGNTIQYAPSAEGLRGVSGPSGPRGRSFALYSSTLNSISGSLMESEVTVDFIDNLVVNSSTDA